MEKQESVCASRQICKKSKGACQRKISYRYLHPWKSQVLHLSIIKLYDTSSCVVIAVVTSCYVLLRRIYDQLERRTYRIEFNRILICMPCSYCYIGRRWVLDHYAPDVPICLSHEELVKSHCVLDVLLKLTMKV